MPPPLTDAAQMAARSFERFCYLGLLIAAGLTAWIAMNLVSHAIGFATRIPGVAELMLHYAETLQTTLAYGAGMASIALVGVSVILWFATGNIALPFITWIIAGISGVASANAATDHAVSKSVPSAHTQIERAQTPIKSGSTHPWRAPKRSAEKPSR